MELFCNQDADLLATDQYGMTSLHHAARFGHKGIVKYLIENGKVYNVQAMPLLQGYHRNTFTVVSFCKAWDPIFVNFVVEQIPKIKLSRIKPTICFGRDISFRIFKIVFITKSTKLMLKNINEITVSLNLMEFLPAC